MTAQDIITTTRKNLTDTHPGQERWTNQFLFKYISEALWVTYQRRPDLFLSEDAITVPTEITAVDDDIGVDDEYLQAIGYYTSYRALMEDNADTENIEQANSFLKMYSERLGLV